MAEAKLKIAAFSKYLGYAVGGSEKSLMTFLDRLEQASPCTIKILFSKSTKSFNSQRLPQSFPADYTLVPFEPITLFGSLFFYDYLFNRKRIQKLFSALQDDILYAQGLWSPAALNAFPGKKVRFIRDEFDLNVWGNYHEGFPRLLKYLYQLFQLPGYLLYVRDNLRSLRQADEIIANSQYTAHRVLKLAGRKATIRYPDVDMPGLRARYQSLLKGVNKTQKGIVISGDEKIKGISLFRTLARHFPRETFIIFSRRCEVESRSENIITTPWVKDSAELYIRAKIVVVPSRCNEGFGRVAYEARQLNIPVVVSNRGGLPEAVENDPEAIAENFADWKAKLSRLLASAV